MNPKQTPPARDANEEISALIATLHQTEQRLEELTAGEVDTVADRAGRMLLLRRAQEHMRYNEAAKQAAILNALPARIALLDSQGRIISVNEAWRRFGSANVLHGPEHGIGLNYLEICDSARGDDAAEPHQAAAGIRSVLAGGVRSFSIEYPRHSPTEQRWFLLTVTPLADDHANGAIVMHLDITERKRMAEALRTSEREQRQLAEQLGIERSRLVAAQRVAKVGSWETDIATMSVIWSDETQRIYETDPATFRPTHQGFLEFIHPEDRARVDEAFGRSLDQHAASAIEHRVLMPDGRIKFVDERWQVSFDKEEKPVRVIGTCQDITERKRAEEALARESHRNQIFLRNASDGVHILDADGNVVEVSDSFCQMLGYSREELIGANVMLWDAQRAPQELKRRIAEMSGTEGRLVFETRHRRRDGSFLDVEVAAQGLELDGKRALFNSARDITGRKRTEEEIRRYVEQLKTAFMSTVEVVTTLSEMRDPYTAGHERRVAEIAVAIGAELGFDAHRQEGLQVAGHLHDIGKITIPSEILSKPGKLSAIEFQLIQGHAQAGYAVLERVEWPWPVAEIALQHHERLDGSGYPQGLKGEAILLEARIMGVADVVEAMSSHRPYRPGRGIAEALAEIERGRGTVYDQGVAAACLKLFREKGYAVPA